MSRPNQRRKNYNRQKSAVELVGISKNYAFFPQLTVKFNSESCQPARVYWRYRHY